MIVEIPNCTLLLPELMAALPIAKALATIGLSRRGELSLTVTQSSSGLDIAATGGSEPDRTTLERLVAEAEKADVARLAWNGEIIATRRPPMQYFGRAAVVPPPGAFLQATQHGEHVLLSAVREIVGDAASVVDLFPGCGTFSLPLAETARVHAVEGSADMTEALSQGWRGVEGLKQVTAETRDLFRNPLLADELVSFDACVIDPPRAGAEAQIAELAKARVPRIAHVSCNPVTFARDAGSLVEAGYRLDWVQPVDQFRWSAHVELVASFTLNSA
jgi:23S rRNA (uracil1939-C5)-methyltransferase